MIGRSEGTTPMTPQQRGVRDQVAAIPDRVTAAARAADPEPPSPGEWPPTDVVRHLIAVEDEVWQPRLRQLIADDEPRWPWTEPGRWPDRPEATLDDLLAVHADRRAETVAMLDGLDDAGWERAGIHAVYGRLDVAGLMRKALTHDEEHIESFER
jgi:DinB family protein